MFMLIVALVALVTFSLICWIYYRIAKRCYDVDNQAVDRALAKHKSEKDS